MRVARQPCALGAEEMYSHNIYIFDVFRSDMRATIRRRPQEVVCEQAKYKFPRNICTTMCNVKMVVDSPKYLGLFLQVFDLKILRKFTEFGCCCCSFRLLGHNASSRCHILLVHVQLYIPEICQFDQNKLRVAFRVKYESTGAHNESKQTYKFLIHTHTLSIGID